LDISFDSLGRRLERRIYQGPKGQIRLAVLQRDLEPWTKGMGGVAVADLGCGGGHMSLWAAQWAGELWLCDLSAKQLGEGKKRLEDFGGVLHTFHGPMAQSSFPAGYFSLVMNHGVLGWTEDPWFNLEYSLSLLKPGGYLSLLVFNPHRWMLKKARLGHWQAVREAKPAYIKGKTLSPPHPLNPQELESFLKDRGEILQQSGVRIFWEGGREQSWSPEVLDLELAKSQTPPFRDFAYHTHWLLQKP
jgi:S-adenosylmethionine-dependent methyltransferase